MDTKLITELRNLTKAGLNDCKLALQEAENDLEKAVDIIKIKGLNIVSTISNAVTTEGQVASRIVGNFAYIIKVHCQTDFAARSPEFAAFLNDILDQLILLKNTNQPISTLPELIEDKRKQVIATLKENIVLSDFKMESTHNSDGKLFLYQHSNNKMLALVNLFCTSENAANAPEVKELGENLAMQVAAMNPIVIVSDHLHQTEIDRQTAIFKAQLIEANKPEASHTKIIEGKMNKWFSEICLLHQNSVTTPKLTVKDMIKEVEKSVGNIKVLSFERLEV